MTSKWVTTHTSVEWKNRPVTEQMDRDAAIDALLAWLDCYDGMANNQDDFATLLDAEEKLARAARRLAVRHALEGPDDGGVLP